MTAYEEWLTRVVDVLLGGAFSSECGDPEPNTKEWGDRKARAEAARRAAVILTHARALECRHLAAELIIRSAEAPLATKVIAQAIAAQCTERSHKLEQLAMRFAQPDGWPIKSIPQEQQQTETVQ